MGWLAVGGAGVLTALVCGWFLAGQLISQWMVEASQGEVHWELTDYTLLEMMRKLKQDRKWFSVIVLGCSSLIWPYIKSLVSWILLALCTCCDPRPCMLTAVQWVEHFGRWVLADSMLVLIMTVTLHVTVQASEMQLSTSDQAAVESYFPLEIQFTQQSGTWIFAGAACASLLLGSVMIHLIDDLRPRERKVVSSGIEFWVVLLMIAGGLALLVVGLFLTSFRIDYELLGVSTPSRDWSVLSLLKQAFALDNSKGAAQDLGRVFLASLIGISLVLAPVAWLVCCTLLWCGASWAWLFDARTALGRWCALDVLLVTCVMLADDILPVRFSVEAYLQDRAGTDQAALDVLNGASSKQTNFSMSLEEGFWVLLVYTVWSFVLGLILECKTEEQAKDQADEILPLLSGEAAKPADDEPVRQKSPPNPGGWFSDPPLTTPSTGTGTWFGGPPSQNDEEQPPPAVDAPRATGSNARPFQGRASEPGQQFQANGRAQSKEKERTPSCCG